MTTQTDFHSKNIFDWPLFDLCKDEHLTEAALYLGQLVAKFNIISKSYHLLLTEKEANEIKYKKLNSNFKHSEPCENCVLLERRLNSQNEKFKELERPVNQYVKQEPLTQQSLSKSPKHIEMPIVDTNVLKKTPNKIWKESQNHRIIDGDFTLIKTPTKQYKIEKDYTGEINETIVGESTSPILRKSKVSRIKSKNNVSMKWKEEKQWKSKNMSTPSKENHDVDLSPSLLSSSAEIDNLNKGPLACTSIDNTIEFTEAILETKSKKRKKPPKLDLSFTKNKYTENKHLKQSRLSFKNAKPKIPIDVTTTENFLGGMRNSPNYMSEQSDETSEKDFIINKKVILNKSNVNVEVDTIYESPSCISHKPTKVKKMENISTPTEVLFHRETSNSSMIIEDDDETMLFTMPENIRLRKSDTPPDSKKPKLANLKLTPLKDHKQTITFKSPIPERIYKEDPIRKKADKAKVPGWSCAKCSEFYNIAFKGDEEMIKKKINECSKHRGKFNPERRNTPPGFWDVNMPQTPDTYDCRNE